MKPELKEILKKRQPNIPYKDGVLSVIAHDTACCYPTDNNGVYTHVEIAYINQDGNFTKIPELESIDPGAYVDEMPVYLYIEIEKLYDLLINDKYSKRKARKIIKMGYQTPLIN